MAKFNNHYRKNQFWLWSAMEVYGIGIYFILQTNFFDIHPPAHTVLAALDDPSVIFLLAVAGTFILTYSIWDFHWFYARPIMIAVLFFVISVYFGAFALHDYETGYLNFVTILLGLLLCRIVSYAFTGDD